MKLSPKQREALELVSRGQFYPCLVQEEDGWHARWCPIGVEENGWVDEIVREAAMTRLTEDAEEQKHETLHDAWMMALKSRTGLVVWDDAECRSFSEELNVWADNGAENLVERKAIAFNFAPIKGGFSLSCAIPKGREALRALGRAVYVWSPLLGLKKDGECLCVKLSQSEAEDFVRIAAHHLRNAGYTVHGVDIGAEISASVDVDKDVKLTIKVAGEVVSAKEIRFLLDQASSLVYFRDRWIEVDRGILKEALRALEKGLGKKANIMTFALGVGHIGRLEIEEVRAHGWLRGLVNELRNSGTFESELTTIEMSNVGLEGTLRDYQRRGVEWLGFLTGHGFGALLADDMGLGKTVQTIAWLLNERAKGLGKVLIVAPLTLLSNWKHEFAKFAPKVSVYVHQGETRHLASGFKRAVSLSEVTITSYNLIVRDHSEFSETHWDVLVLDEAQAIKNPDTQVSRAIKALTPAKRLAITGTPIENSVADIWSIEEFLNPGFLGDRKSFASRFVKPIAADEDCAAKRRLHRALEPFVLRRLKTDSRIAAELGEKHEIREYCELTSDQRREYEMALADFHAREHSQGDVFALITQLKLICDGAGKLERLFELLESIFESGESALIFSQYAKVGAWITKEISEHFSRRFPFLHGGLSVKEREAEIARFNRRGPNAFVLSLKAGGFGLNLTKATHVIHFDRWWNPAVENQATDRAHRIGQSQTVFVHLFISAGTLEEHVDDLLRQKSKLASAVISEAEWLEAVKYDG